jgi:hypothetical protein
MDTYDAAFVQMGRDHIRKTARPLNPDCDHDEEPLPIVDMYVDYVCLRCGGFESRSPWQQQAAG